MPTRSPRGSLASRSSAAAAKLERPDGCKGVEFFRKGSKLDDMVAALDDSKVLFGVIKTGQNSAGAFSRKSTVFLVNKGDQLGQVKASKIMAHKFAVQSYCASYTTLTGQVNCYDKSNLKALIMEEIGKSTIDDSKDIGDLDYQLGDTKAGPKTPKAGGCEKFELDLSGKGGYGMCICGRARREHAKEALAAALDEQETAAPAAEKGGGGGYSADAPAELPQVAKPAAKPVVDEGSRSKIAHLKRQASQGFATTEYANACKEGTPPSAGEILEIVRDMYGTPYNWVLFKANKDKLEVEDAGGGGVVELSGLLERLASDKLLYGFVRVAFGHGKLRRAWMFSLHWQGEKCSGVKAMTQKRECLPLMDETMQDASFTIEAMGPDDVMPEAVIDKLVSSVVIDGKSSDISVKSLIDALEEEQEAIREFHASKERKKREAEELEKQRLEAEARKLEEEAEKKRLEAEEAAKAEAAAREAAAAAALAEAAAAAAAVGTVGADLEALAESDEDAWVLFEVVV